MTTPTHVKEAAEACKKYADGWTDTRAERFEEILLEHLPKPSEWVDVRDGLPDEKQAIDAYNAKDEQRVQTRFLSEDMFCGRPWFTHWTPLLPPPITKEKA